MIQAITPLEARKAKNIPEFVLESVNELIVQKLGKSDCVTITQDELINRIFSKKGVGYGDDIFRQTIFSNHWLDFESLYEEAGWEVVYVNSTFADDYKPFFKFTQK